MHKKMCSSEGFWKFVTRIGDHRFISPESVQKWWVKIREINQKYERKIFSSI